MTTKFQMLKLVSLCTVSFALVRECVFSFILVFLFSGLHFAVVVSQKPLFCDSVAILNVNYTRKSCVFNGTKEHGTFLLHALLFSLLNYNQKWASRS